LADVKGGTKREQQFDASALVVKKKLIAAYELKRGKPVHTLLIHLDGHPMFVFGEQDNARCAHDVATVELTDTSLRVVYARGRGPYAGKTQLRSVVANFKATKAQLTRMEKLLATLGDDDREH
jgi:hypothetical protein